MMRDFFLRILWGKNTFCNFLNVHIGGWYLWTCPYLLLPLSFSFGLILQSFVRPKNSVKCVTLMPANFFIAMQFSSEFRFWSFNTLVSYGRKDKKNWTLLFLKNLQIFSVQICDRHPYIRQYTKPHITIFGIAYYRIYYM